MKSRPKIVNAIEKNISIQMIDYNKATKPSFHLGLIDLKLEKKNKEAFIVFLVGFLLLFRKKTKRYK